ncbi:hypothetical protein MRB53_036213 [Persea americana]|uniref:Uncharacterized protein n=1 Tax=Persea americana TaxID=3435 RepID=A0ACC2K6X9_PERAE|nr:hypothetical protein MRB53_036213 [Persea americana]
MAGSFAIRDRCPDPHSFSETPPLFIIRPSTKASSASACCLFLPNNKQNQTMDLSRCICSSSMSLFAIDPNHNDIRPTSMICFDQSCPTSKTDTPSLFPFTTISPISTMHKFNISGPVSSHPFLLRFQRTETPKLFTSSCLLCSRLSLLRSALVGSRPPSI